MREQLDRPCTWDIGSTVTVHLIAPFKESHIVFHLARSLLCYASTSGLLSVGLVGPGISPYISLGTVHLAVITFKFRDEGDSGAGNSSDGRGNWSDD